MSKLFRFFVSGVLLAVLLTGTAHAGWLGEAKSWFTGEVLALFVSGVIALLGGIFGIMFKKVIKTFKEAGEFMTELGTALEDHHVTREELAGIVKEGKEIFAVWR